MYPRNPTIVFLDPIDRFYGIEPSAQLGGIVFPQEIMMEILSRVPAQSLMLLREVNHAWDNLTRDRFFISRMHLHQMKENNKVGYMFQSQYDLYPLEYGLGLPDSTHNNRIQSPNEPEVYVIASCGGLVLLCNSADEFHLYNPSTCVMFMIPHKLIVLPTGSTFASAIFGMGYVDEDHVFKIMRVCCFNNREKDTIVSLLSTDTMEWVDLGQFPYPSPVGHHGVFVGGCINWQAEVGIRTECIATFNYRTHVFGRIDLPPRMETVHVYGEIGALDDERLVLYSSCCITFAGFEMWVLDQYGASDSWLRLRFPMGGVINLEERALGIQPLRLMKHLDDSILFRIEPLDQYFLYHLHRGTYEQLEAPVTHEDYGSVFPFVQTVVDPRFLMH